jgi:hypothetical protein
MTRLFGIRKGLEPVGDRVHAIENRDAAGHEDQPSPDR